MSALVARSLPGLTVLLMGIRELRIQDIKTAKRLAQEWSE